MLIHIDQKTTIVQTHWSVGYCGYCGCYEALCIGDVVKATRVFLIAVSQTADEVCYCDFCGQRAKPAKNAQLILLKNWCAEWGMEDLFDRCTPGFDPGPSRCSTEEGIDRVLRHVAKVSAVKRINVDDALPPVIGAIVGTAICLPIGILLQDNGNVAVGISLLIGILGGGLFGIVAGSFVLGARLARRLLSKAYVKYRIDPDLLSHVAGNYPDRIRRAVAIALATPPPADKA